ncbi:MAG: phage tail sheath subtilisin-like domain-containing protein [Acidobacteriota bacterium]|nr:phage tail sheath subtilisin-like domain-containing protein [Acidobacteriota bacterium]
MSLVIENTKPGVTAILNAGQVSRPLERQPTSTFFAVGVSDWGPVKDPKVVTSWNEFVRLYGKLNSNSYLTAAANIFFNLFPGQTMYVSRVVGAAAAKATKNLMDRAGTPLATLKVDALYPSTKVDISVTVAAGTSTNTVKLTFTSVYLNITEIYDDFKVDADSISKVNTFSRLIRLTNLNSATVAPNNLPAVAAKSALTGGSDDFAGVNTATYVGGLDAFRDENLGTGQVAIPGISGAHPELITHAETFKRLAILDPAFASDLDAVKTAADAARSPYAAIYYPWVQMRDLEGTGVLKFYPPSAFAAGACAQVDRTIGTHKAPANIRVPNALDVERNADGSPLMTDSAREFLNRNQVNAIAPLPGEGIKIYGARVLYPRGETRVRFVHEQRMLNLIYYVAKFGYQWAVFAVVDGQGRLFRDLRAAGITFLNNLWRSGGLYGAKPEQAFIVICDESNNPPDELEQGRVHVQFGVKISPTAEVIIINIDNVPLSQSLDILQGQNV